MKLKEMIKRFWTLDVHNHEGFTLVELIIVIAILAILASVGVVGYSSYVKKANMQADRTLAAEIANALTLYYYANADKVTDGYVVLTPEGVACVSDDNGKAAMDAAFGEGWENTLSLKYDGWLATSEGGGNFTNIPTQTITDAVSSLTNLAGAASNANKPSTITTVLYSFCGQNADMKAELESYEGEDNYSDIATNLMVKYLSDELSRDNVVYDDENGEFTYADGSALSSGANMAMMYAMLFSMANDADNPNRALAQNQLNTFTSTIQDIAEREATDANSTSVGAELDSALNDMLMNVDDNGVPFYMIYSAYLGSNPNEVSDIGAALGVMSDLAEGYTDAETLGNSDLFSSSAVVNAVNAYKLAAEHGGVVISISDGMCVVVPKLEG